MLEKLIVMVEEPSMEAALELLLPKMLGNIEFQIIRFQCKDDLLKHLPSRLSGYQSWLPPSWAIVVLLDRDDDDCIVLKQQLENIAAHAGLTTKTHAGSGNSFRVANRIAIEELEAWFFGDWSAVKTAYPRLSSNISQKSLYRDPDTIRGGTWEAFERELKRSGYFKTGLRKLECARDIAPHMDVVGNTSRSFQEFRAAVSAAIAWV
jgi:hypothetical protein